MKVVTLAAVLLSCVSCVYDEYNAGGGTDGSAVTVELSIQTHAATSTSETYVAGSEWENYIDINGGDYRIYFFTYNPDNSSDASTNNTLIAEFKPDDIYSYSTDDSGAYTTYRATGEVDASMAEYGDFKVVMLANWGTYPEVTAGVTTIDDICDAETAVFNAFVDGSGNAVLPSANLHIPFYGVHEYSGIEWESGKRTTLSGTVTLLRAVAKVEVTVANDAASGVTFDDVSVVNYNNTGYCAPSGVYLRNDYDSGYTDWSSDFTNTPHLVGDVNDSDEKSITLYKTTNGDGQETWVGYLTEYANGGTDYSYLSVTVEEEPFWVYFGNYNSDGTCTAYDGTDTSDRFDIFRNNLYRFYVTYEGGYFRVRVNQWEDVYDNEFTFGSDTGEEGEGENP